MNQLINLPTAECRKRSNKKNAITQGEIYEQQAALFLRKKGLNLITTRFRSLWGEIDLIMQEQEILVFIEVRFRKKNFFGNGAESIDSKKRKKITKTALIYMQNTQTLNKIAFRFDVISMAPNKVEWIKNAF